MLAMRDHNVEDYATLGDMDTTDVAVLDEADRACLEQLGQYLVSTDTWQRFAIWLLHKHFEPAAGEVFAESVIPAPRGTQTTPVERTGQGLNATSMRFDPDVSSGVGVIVMEFADPAEFGSTSSVSPDDEAVLAGISERLQAYGKTERFGVPLIRNPLGLGDNEVLVETCDIAHRTLHCSVGERDGDRAANAVETSWQWSPSLSKTRPRPIQKCASLCWPIDDSHFDGHQPVP
ncbi:MAG: hypothetical protein JWP83_5305 [Mycobacterium sp.]|uniref:hypothetical protein n=1 Tax=Mycobacterium sp. TaxID=1785 RepID=UPI0026323743|nr:hypothetical protein [Mycobacterium sp.]MCW2664153.1 hypothetical protein [Mycobacterium sp.]